MISMPTMVRPQIGVTAILGIAVAACLLAAAEWQPFGPTELVAIVSVFAGAIISGLAGFAFSAVAGSLMLHWVAPAQTVPLLLACSITTQLMSIVSLRHVMDWRRCMPLLIGGVFGIPLGAWLLEALSANRFAAGFGLFLVCYSAYALLRPSLRVRAESRFFDVAAGFLGGITGGSVAFPGAIPTIWYCLRSVPKETQRGAIQPFILIMQIGTIIYFSKLGLFAAKSIGDYLWCAPATLLGTWTGLALFRAVDDTLFRRIVLVFLLISGLVLAL